MRGSVMRGSEQLPLSRSGVVSAQKPFLMIVHLSPVVACDIIAQYVHAFRSPETARRPEIRGTFGIHRDKLLSTGLRGSPNVLPMNKNLEKLPTEGGLRSARDVSPYIPSESTVDESKTAFLATLIFCEGTFFFLVCCNPNRRRLLSAAATCRHLRRRPARAAGAPTTGRATFVASGW